MSIQEKSYARFIFFQEVMHGHHGIHMPWIEMEPEVIFSLDVDVSGALRWQVLSSRLRYYSWHTFRRCIFSTKTVTFIFSHYHAGVTGEAHRNLSAAASVLLPWWHFECTLTVPDNCPFVPRGLQYACGLTWVFRLHRVSISGFSTLSNMFMKYENRCRLNTSEKTHLSFCLIIAI